MQPLSKLGTEQLGTLRIEMAELVALGLRRARMGVDVAMVWPS